MNCRRIIEGRSSLDLCQECKAWLLAREASIDPDIKMEELEQEDEEEEQEDEQEEVMNDLDDLDPYDDEEEEVEAKPVIMSKPRAGGKRLARVGGLV